MIYAEIRHLLNECFNPNPYKQRLSGLPVTNQPQNRENWVFLRVKTGWQLHHSRPLQTLIGLISTHKEYLFVQVCPSTPIKWWWWPPNSGE